MFTSEPFVKKVLLKGAIVRVHCLKYMQLANGVANISVKGICKTELLTSLKYDPLCWGVIFVKEFYDIWANAK